MAACGPDSPPASPAPQGQTPEPTAVTAKPSVKLTTVVVATRPLRFGMELSKKHLKEIEWPKGAIPEGSFSTIASVMKGEGRRIILSAIARNEPVIKTKVTGNTPDNPLGEYALYLGWQSYLIHGTNDPRGVGRHSSRGCIRLYPWHIEGLYGRVEPGTKVRVVNEPVKVGWVGNMLLLEVNPDSELSLTLDQTGKRPASRIPLGLRDLVTRAAGKQAHRLDWGRIKRAALRQSGVPTAILRSERRPARAAR